MPSVSFCPAGIPTGRWASRRSRKKGGFTFAQTGNDTKPLNPDMPESAIGSELIDFAIPVEDMPEKLRQIIETRSTVERVVQKADDEDDDLKTTQENAAELLRNQTDHDFSGYKSRTFLRRIARRMQVTHDQTTDAYVERLRQEPDEVRALFRDLLINVTEFFRDPDAFEVLEAKVIPELFKGRGANDTIRIWIPGCSTGEEVYSIGILMRERLDGLDARPNVQIFATDIDESALSIARTGRYPAGLLANIGDSRRHRFFRKDGASWVVVKDLRDLCMFSPHSVISDPPFSRMDLVSCRNLLISLGSRTIDFRGFA